MSDLKHKNCKILEDSSEDLYSVLDFESGFDIVTHEHIEVESSATAIHCPFSTEVLGVDHLFADPRIGKSLGIDFLNMEQEGTIGMSSFEDFSTKNDCHDLKPNFDDFLATSIVGFLDNNVVEGVNHNKFFDGIFQGDEEENNLHLSGEILNNFPDYVRDVFPGKSSVFYHAPTKYSSSPKLDSEYQYQNYELDCNTADLTDLKKAIVPLPESTFDQNNSFMENMSLDELHEAFKSTFGRDTFINDKEWLKRRVLFGLQGIKDDGISLPDSKFVSIDNEHSSLLFLNMEALGKNDASFSEVHDSGNSIEEKNTWGTNAGNEVNVYGLSRLGCGEISKLEDRNEKPITKKRLRKPTRRYIEELSENQSRNCNERMEPHSSYSPNRTFDGTKNQFLYHDLGMGSTAQGEDPMIFGNQFSSTIQSRRGRPRKKCTLLLRVGKGNKDLKPCSPRPKKMKNPDHYESDSQDDFSVGFGSTHRKVGGKRKHHRQWTLTEVLKLVEGVSQYGVGRWTEIKRIHFATSGYRTSVDLKDKWRNLLRAAGAHNHGKKEVNASKKHITLPIPASVSRRVRELSTIHPYPRERKFDSPSLDNALVPTNINYLLTS